MLNPISTSCVIVRLVTQFSQLQDSDVIPHVQMVGTLVVHDASEHSSRVMLSAFGEVRQ